MRPFLNFFNDPVLTRRTEDPLACDFAVGNPQEMPLPGFVDSLQRHTHPQDKDWYAYKLNETEPRQALQQELLNWRGIHYDTEDIFFTNGGFAAIAITLSVLVNPGDEVIMNIPPWFFYDSMIVANGGKAIRVKVKNPGFDLDLEGIEAAITPRTKAIIVNSPNNPTGKIYPPETLIALAQALTRAQAITGRPIYLLSDEAYSRIVFAGHKFMSPTQFYPHSFLLYTYGKQLLAPGQRLGFVVLPPEMPDRETMRQAIFTAQLVNGYSFPNALLLHALADLNQLSIDIPHLQRKRDFMAGALQEIGYEVNIPQGTFYLMLRSPWEDDLAYIRLLNRHKIFCLPGTVVEMPGYFRLSLTASDDMIQRSLPGFAAALKSVQANA